MASPKSQPAAASKAPKWKASTKFVEYRGRKMVIKLVDEENGFKPAQAAMTVNGPAYTSHAYSVQIDKDGYVPKTEAEEAALLKLAELPNGHSRGSSFLVLWENREMPEEQRKAELTAADYRKRVEELEAQVADRPALEEENRQQADHIARLEKELAGRQGG
jgi:hypothetical protein